MIFKPLLLAAIFAAFGLPGDRRQQLSAHSFFGALGLDG
jgi:hypothetical protein